MEKLIYLIGNEPAGRAPRAAVELREHLLAASSRLHSAGAQEMTLHVADLDATATSGFPQMNATGFIDASLSLWLDSLDTRSEIEEALGAIGTRRAGYLVTESVPLRRILPHAIDTPFRCPGITLVSTFDKPEGLDLETFYARWHGSHTPLSLEIHPLESYVRNSVVRCLTTEAPSLLAIVSESVASADLLLDPGKFHGSEENRKRATRDLLSFADLGTMSAVLMSEYILGP